MSYTVNPVFLSGSNVEQTNRVSTLLKPLQLQYNISNNVKIKSDSQIFQDGFRVYKNNLFNNTKDSVATKNTLFYLTNGAVWDEFLYDGYNLNIGNLNNSSKILFDRLNNTGFFYAYIQYRTNTSNPFSFVYLTDDYTLSVSETDKSFAKFTKLDNGKVKISFFKQEERYGVVEYLLTVDVATYDHKVRISSTREKLTNFVQEFNIYLIENSVYISYNVPTYNNFSANDINVLQSQVYSYAPNIERYIGIINNELVCTGIARDITGTATNINKYSDDTNVYKTNAFALVNNGYQPLQLGIEDDKQNTWVGYHNELYDKTNNRNVKPNPKLTVSRVPINYLVTSNYQTSFNSASSTIDVNIVPLKTTYTAEQETIRTPTVNIEGTDIVDAPDNLQPIQRSYTKLFVSNNDIENYSKVHLGYSSNTKEITFAADANTYFHYPLQASRISLADGNLIQAGAIPGATPYLSDKIFMKNAAYGDKSVWGHLTPPPGCLNGQFLCAWLSGSDASSLSGLENSVWMNRWYDSAKVTEISALHTSTNFLSSNLNGTIIYDEPSNLILNPGGWYYYHHVGNKIISKFIDSFNLGTTALRLNLQCDSSNMMDESNYDNTVDIINKKTNSFVANNPDEALVDNYVLSLDGTNYGKVQYNSSLDVKKDITVSMWAYSKRWDNNPGYHVLDNDFRGGWSIAASNGFFNPTISVGENTYGHVLNFSDTLKPYTDNMLISANSSKLNPDNVIVTDELYVYAFDKNTKSLCKFEYSGDLLDLIDLSTYTSTITNSKLLLGPNNILHLHFNDKLIKTDVNFSSVSSQSLPYTNFTIDLSGNVIGANVVDITVDNFNTVWFISSCPGSFFTSATALFEVKDYFGVPNIAQEIESTGDTNFVFYSKTNTTTIEHNPIRVVGLNGYDITFPAFFDNNAANAVISKFFQPTRLGFDKDNNLYIGNSTQELMKLIVREDSLAGFLYRKPLLNNNYTTGLSLSAPTSGLLIQIEKYNSEHREEKAFEYIQIIPTSTYWVDIQPTYTKQNYFNFLYEYDEIDQVYTTFIYYTDNNLGILYKFDPDGNYITSVKMADGFDIETAPSIDVFQTNYTNVATTYDWHRKYDYERFNTGSKSRIRLDLYTISTATSNISLHTLNSNCDLLINKEWHHVAFTYKPNTGKVLLYVDGVVVDSKTIETNSEIYYKYENDIGIGTTMLRSGSLEQELATPSYKFYGDIDDVRIYDHVLTPGNIGRLILNKYKIHDMIWNIPIGSKSYIEEIEHFFKHKPPGSKSPLFNLFITNSGITDPELQQEIENIIKDAIPRVTPPYTRLNKIYWK